MKDITYRHDGPWDWHYAKHDDGRNNGSVIANASSGRAVCVCKAPQYATAEQWSADARLIAAAPDLLRVARELSAILRELIEDECCDHPAGICYCGIRTALAGADDIVWKTRTEFK